MNSPRSSVPAPLDSEFDSESDHPPSLPAIDERLVAPESDAEIIDGIVYDTPGADQAHGTLHFDAAHLFAGVLADGYAGAVNMLSRLDELSDAAPDISVFPALPDPKTEGRQLEEIVVEVLDTERVGRATTKVEKFAARGVRRLFAVRVASRKVYEWDHADHDWIEFTDDAVITDPCFRVPVPARALIDRVLARDTVAEALIERDHRVIVEALARREHQGRREGREEGLGPLVHQFERRLGRALSVDERDVLQSRLGSHGPARLGDVVLDLDSGALAVWLADRDAR
jgi:hypothetical protein